jgi:hypothetical protein
VTSQARTEAKDVACQQSQNYRRTGQSRTTRDHCKRLNASHQPSAIANEQESPPPCFEHKTIRAHRVSHYTCPSSPSPFLRRRRRALLGAQVNSDPRVLLRRFAAILHHALLERQRRWFDRWCLAFALPARSRFSTGAGAFAAVDLVRQKSQHHHKQHLYFC